MPYIDKNAYFLAYTAANCPACGVRVDFGRGTVELKYMESTPDNMIVADYRCSCTYRWRSSHHTPLPRAVWEGGNPQLCHWIWELLTLGHLLGKAW